MERSMLDKMYAASEQEAREIGMFGCTIADLRQSIERSLGLYFSGPGMVAVSMMSDAQEEIERGMKETARQTLNRAKFVVTEYLSASPARLVRPSEL